MAQASTIAAERRLMVSPAKSGQNPRVSGIRSWACGHTTSCVLAD
jgi:hypothetical protein